MSNLELSILKELDVQNISGNNISIIMEKLDTNDKKNEFLAYMINNRNVLLSFKDMIEYINRGVVNVQVQNL